MKQSEIMCKFSVFLNFVLPHLLVLIFFQTTLQKKAISSLMNLTDFMRDKSSIIVIVGLPLQVKNSLYNVAAVISDEGVLGFVPKIFISNSDRFYGERWFVSGEMLTDFIVEINGENIPISPGGTIFQTPFGNFGVEICKDLWMPIPSSSHLAMQGPILFLIFRRVTNWLERIIILNH